MKKRKSFFAQTFLFTSVLIFVVLFLAFFVLYRFLPHYYFRVKEKNLAKSAALLVETIESEPTEQGIMRHLYDFSIGNNATVYSFNENGYLIEKLSSPFLNLIFSENLQIQVYPTDAMETSAAKEDSSESWEDTVSIYIEPFAQGSVATWEVSPSTGIAIASRENYQVMTETETDESEFSVIGFSQQEGSPQIIQQAFTGNTLSANYSTTSPFVDKLYFTSPLQPIDEASQVIFSLLPPVLVASLGVGLLLAFWYSRKISSPISALSQVTEEMEAMNPLAKAEASSSNELSVLSSNLNSLYQKLTGTIDMLQGETQRAKELERSKTQLMQSASHELKTPLAALNGITEGMIDRVGIYKDRDRYLQESKVHIDNLTQLVQEIITASEADSQPHLLLEEVSLTPLVQLVLQEQHPMKKEKNLQVTTHLTDFQVTTDYKFLKRSISNLISNAFRHSHPEDTISVSLAKEKEGMVFTVKNPWVPVSQEELSQLADPFYTGDYSRNSEEHGTGLGLYIVSQHLRKLDFPFSIANQDGFFVATIIFPQ